MNKSAKMTENFSKKYTQTNFITRRIIENFYNSIKTLIRDLPIKNALEAACGPGFSTKYLLKIRPDVAWEASDIAPNLVQEAQEKNPDTRIIDESIYKLTRPDASYNLVVALEVLEHIDKPDQALIELERVSSKFCLVSVPREPIWRILNMMRGAYWKNLGNTPEHINHWSAGQFKKLVSPYFKIIAQATPLPWTILLLEKKLANKP